nr:PIN domain-containing protein [Candidatus Freyarchaeota archaeon]
MTSMSMAKLVFVDTWAWLALANRKDSNHKSAFREYKEMRRENCIMVTSDYVLDEVITALFRNVVFVTAVRFIEALHSMIKNDQLKLERISEERFRIAWQLRKKLKDKPNISFTDLTSFGLMQELKITKVFTGDADFVKVNLGFEIVPK